MQHEIGLERLVAVFEIGLVGAAQLFLDAYRQARHEGLAQTPLVGNGRGHIELVALIQPPAHGQRCDTFGVVLGDPAFAHRL